MASRTPLVAIAIAAALSFALTGCVQGSTPTGESSPPAPSAEPAMGDLINGTGYSVSAPEGWTVPDNAPTMADIYVIGEEADDDGFVDTLNVILGTATDDSLSETETGGAAHLEEVYNATDVEVKPRIAIAGTESAHISAHLENGDFGGWTEQYLLVDDGVVYTISFTFREAVPSEDREALAESVLDTWAWSESPTTTSGAHFEDPVARYAVTFPGEPVLDATGADTRATYSTEEDPRAADAVVFTARGTAASEVEIDPETLNGVFFAMLNRGIEVTGPEEWFELAGIPAVMNSFIDADGKPATMVVAGEGHRYFQLVVAGGTPEQRQEFFDSFTLLD